MRKLYALLSIALFAFTLGRCVWAQGTPTPVGIFESHGDVGTVLHPGSVEYDSARQHLHDQRQRREYVVHRRRFSVRLEGSFRRRHSDR